jgi:hypothetical protein
MKIFKLIFLALLLTCLLQATHGQIKQQKTTPPSQIKIKQPKLKTYLTNTTDSIITLNVDQAKAVIGNTLKVADDRMNIYSITYYQFLYKRKVLVEDEKTGKMSPTTSIASDNFRSTPLSNIWTKTIREQLIPGEELYFFDVVVKNTQGTPFYAPSLKILIQ